jgi:endonuclease G
MRSLIFAGLLLCGSAFASSTPHCDQMVPFGYPTSQVVNTTKLCRISYYVLHNNDLKTPVYVAELLLPENISGTNPRINKFKADPELAVNSRATPEDYSNSGYDRGHMAPVENMRSDSAAMLQSFYMSNVIPQNASTNRGVWRSIEEHVRDIAIAYDGVHVFTGPIYSRTYKTIGAGVAVPSSMFKVVINKNMYQGIAYIVPNKDVTGSSPKSFITTIEEVERQTGIEFTPLLNDSMLLKTTNGFR